MQRYRADRAFDDFNAGQEVELNPSDEQHARWIATGYLEPLEDTDPDDETAEPGKPELGETAAPGDSVETSSTPNEPAPVKKGRRRAAADAPADAGTPGETGE